ncbi:MAG TPA: HAMP domain-containing protein, partial [Streptosporangiaceae bacterium]
MRTRLVIAFIIVALLSALAASWFHTLIGAYRLPDWLHDVIVGPAWLQDLVHTAPGQTAPHPVRHTALVFFGVAAGSLLAIITTLAVAATRPVLLPVRRLARAAQRMSGGDLSVRIQARGRDELAQLVTSFNKMASALEDKVRELEQLGARARQFAGDVSHELRTPLTAMTAVVDILHEHPGLTGDAAAAAGLVQQEVQHLNRLVEDLIEISRFDAGTAQLVTDETDVATAIGRCLRVRGWSTVATDAPAGLTARLDRRRFDVILANLVGNAVRHGGSPVTVRASVQPDS